MYVQPCSQLLLGVVTQHMESRSIRESYSCALCLIERKVQTGARLSLLSACALCLLEQKIQVGARLSLYYFACALCLLEQKIQVGARLSLYYFACALCLLEQKSQYH